VKRVIEMKTRITDLFGIRYPIILPGMSWISVPDLVAAVSNAGGLGVLATGPLAPKETKASIQMIGKLTDKPFGAGVTLLMPGARENAEVIIEEKVPVVIFSLGKDKKLFQRIHDYGGKIVCTVTTIKHAHAAIEAGADALSVVGYEAAGHGSLVSTLVLTPSIVDEVNVPVIAGGGIGDGRGLIAALALGADAVYMGTRLAMTKESPVHVQAKNLTLQHGMEDTIYSDRFDGLRCRVLKTPQAEKSISRGMSFPRAFLASLKISRKLKMPWIKVLIGSLMRGGPGLLIKLAHFVLAVEAIEKMTLNGDAKKGVQLTGQVQSIIHDIPAVAELIERIVGQADEICRIMPEKVSLLPNSGSRTAQERL
jgi:enoyl-[acyl-carrier protein] reductase II